MKKCGKRNQKTAVPAGRCGVSASRSHAPRGLQSEGIRSVRTAARRDALLRRYGAGKGCGNHRRCGRDQISCRWKAAPRLPGGRLRSGATSFVGEIVFRAEGRRTLIKASAKYDLNLEGLPLVRRYGGAARQRDERSETDDGTSATGNKCWRSSFRLAVRRVERCGAKNGRALTHARRRGQAGNQIIQ